MYSRIHNLLKTSKITVLYTLFLISTTANAQFTSGNVVVLQVGDGVNTATNTGNQIILREFSTTGTPGFSVNIPTTGSTAIVSSGAATSEGILSNSSDKKLLVFGGYNVALPNSTALSSSASSVIPRAVGAVDVSGNYSLVATSNAFYSGNNMRAATSDGLNNFWGAGGVDGTDYFGNSSSAVNVQNIKVNTRAVAIFNNQLYVSTQSASGAQTLLGIYAVGSGVTSASGQTITNIINTGTGSQPVQFYFQPGASPTVCYVADSRSGAGGGVQKWIYSSSTWSLAYTIPTSTANFGANGVVADFSTSNPMVYATSVETNSNRLVSIMDNGASATATTIATSASNAIFRGLAFSPCATPSISALSSNGPICAGQSLSLSATASGGTLTNFTWYGSGAFSSSITASTSISGASTGAYTLQATNACGASYSVITVTVNPIPQLNITPSSPAVCFGQTLALNATGANSYTWSNGIVNMVSFTPTISTTYSVTGGSAGCLGTATVAVTVNTISLSALPITICGGQSGTLSAGGASSYTWSTGANTSSITVSPSATTAYTVTGTSAAGCVASATTQVVVTNSPAITLNSPTICAGSSATIIANGVNTYTWNTGSNSNSIVVSPLSNTTYSIVGTLAGCVGQATNATVVQVNPTPTISIAGSSTTCAGVAVTLTASGALTYTWNSGAQTATLSINPTITTVYTVSGSNVSGCATSMSKTINVLPLPVLSVVSSSSVICSGQSVTLNASGATTYTWSNGSNASLVSVSPVSTTNYTLSGTSPNGCSASILFTQTVSACTDFNNHAHAPLLVELYPNPASNEIRIQLHEASSADVILFNTIGNVVLEFKNIKSSEHLDVSGLSNGIYYVKVITETSGAIKKLIIE